MLPWLWLVPALPLAGFTLLALIGGVLPRRGVAIVGAGSVGLSALVAALIAAEFIGAPPPSGVYTQVLWTWMSVGDLTPAIALHLDSLSLVMMLVITGVGFLIHVYAAGYLADDDGIRRFFAYLNLFVAFMLLLVLASSLLLLFLGWEGVGMCSWLLIGFWYRDAANGAAAQKAFIVTRIGDAAFVAGLLVIFTSLGTLEIPELLARAQAQWPIGAPIAIAAALLLLIGAVGKSAQVPLQVWLPDAMAGPTPVSALIHAATMVTAGVYLVARLMPMYQLAPSILGLVGLVGALTLLLGAAAALAQHDIKRILAYSTISQIGYMFLALGVGAVSAAMFHLVMHAFFKALLFLAAGAVIVSLGGEHDVRRMGGLARRLPVAFIGFAAGAAALAALPLLTSGFYSKALILGAAINGGSLGQLLWLAGTIGAVLTALYASAVLFQVFLGPMRTAPVRGTGWVMGAPILLLALLSIGGGLIDVPGLLAARDVGAEAHGAAALVTELVVVLFTLGAVWLAYLYFKTGVEQVLPQPMHTRAEHGFGFDEAYGRLVTKPFVRVARVGRRDLLDVPFEALAALSARAHRLVRLTQTGVLRWYASATLIGAVLVLGFAVLLAGLA